jgi:hypothetical protein
MITTLLALLVALFPVQTSDLPHAFPRDGAKQIFDNERVTVWEFKLEKGKQTGMHRHRYDMVRVDLADATVKNRNATGQATNATLRTGTAGFSQKGLTHNDEGTSDTPRHSIIIDLKDVVVPAIPNNSGYVEAFPREGAKRLLDNARVTVWDLSFEVGKPTVTHFHSKDVVVVYLGNAETSSTTPDGKTTLNTVAYGQVKFNPRNRTHSELVVKGTHRVIAVELK